MKTMSLVGRWLVLVVGFWAGVAQAQSLTWDNTAGGVINDGAGAWLGAGLWNSNGTASVTWFSGADAIFGNGGAGGAVTLTSPTTANTLTFNAVSAGYTLGTAGQTLTLNNGINVNSGAGAVTFVSPITLGGAQTWTNNSAGTLGFSGTLTLDNGGNLLTLKNGFIDLSTPGGGLVTLTGAGGLYVDGVRVPLTRSSGGSTAAMSYTGTTTLTNGASLMQNGNLSSGNLTINGGYIESYFGINMTRTLGVGAGQIQLPGGVSGFSEQGSSSTVTLNNNANYEVIWGTTNEAGNASATGYFNPSTLLLQGDTVTSTKTIAFANKIDLNATTRSIQVRKDAVSPATISGVIRTSSGTAGLTKTGVGTLILQGANTFNGPVTVGQGMLSINSIAPVASANPLGQSPASAANLLLANGATLQYTGGVAGSDRGFTINGTVAGDSASLDASGSGALVLTNSASPAYGTVDQARTLVLTGTDTHTNTLAAAIANNGAGAVSVTKTGAGTWVLSGASSYTGPTTLSAGELIVSNANNLGNASANLIFNGGTLGITNTALTSFTALGHTLSLTNGSTLSLDIANAANAFTLDRSLTGVSGLTKSGSGVLLYDQAIPYAGLVTINAGALEYIDGDVPPTTALLNNGALILNRSSGHDLTQGVNFHSFMYGSGSITNIGTGTLALNGINGFWGPTKALAGTVALSHPLALMDSAIDTTGAGFFTLSGVTAPIIGGVTASGTARDLATVISSGYSSVTNLTLNPVGSWTYGGVIANGAPGMTLTISGMTGYSPAGTQILTNNNTYTGATILQGGTLQLSGPAGRLSASTLAPMGGAITLANANATEAAIDRVSNTFGITANGGTITFANTVVNNVPYAETIGAVTLNSGQLNLVENTDQNGTGSNNQTLTLAGLSHPGTATVTFSAPTSPNTTKNMFVVTGASATSAGQIIGPWATAGTNVTIQTDYAVYNGAAQVVPAAIAASAETAWTTPANAYTLNGATALTATRTLAALRYAGAAASLDLAANNLETYGVFNGGSGTLTLTNSSTGVVRTPSGGGNLYLTAGNNNLAVFAPITDNVGATTVVVGGPGYGNGKDLSLYGANTYSGGMVINSGSVIFTNNSAFGAAGGSITFNGSASLVNNTVSATIARNVILNNGAMMGVLQIGNNSTVTISGAVSGNGGVASPHNNNITYTMSFSNPSNTFTGPITIGPSYNAAAGNPNLTVAFASLLDAPGAGNIWFGECGGASFQYTGSSSLVLNNRQFVIIGRASYYNKTATIDSSGSGTLTVNTDLINLGGRQIQLQGSNTGNNLFAGRIPDGGGAVAGLTKNGLGSWYLSNTNTYSGATVIQQGTLSVNSITNVNGGASALGAPVTVANGTIAFGFITAAGTLQYTGSGHTSDRVINLAGTTGGGTLDASGSGALVLTSPLTATGVGSKTLTLTGASTAMNTLVGAIVDNGGANTTALTKSGLGAWVLSGANAFTGVSAITGGGTLVLDYTTQNNQKLAASKALTLSGGTVTLMNGSYAEVASATTLNTAGTFLNRSGSSSGKITLNAITRAVGSTIDLADATIADTSTANANNVLGGWATVGGTNWAVSGSPITAYSSYTALPVGAGLSTVNYLLNGSQTRTNPVTANALKLANSGSGDTLALGTNNLTITSANATSLGGILYAGGGDNNYTISGTSGRIQPSVANQELIFNVNTGTLTISALLTVNASSSPVTKTGPGTLVLGNTNSYTGITYVNQGALRLTNALGAGTSVINVQNGAAVELAGGITVTNAITTIGSGVSNGGALRNVSGNNTYGRAITIGTGGMRINSDGGLLILPNTIALAGNTLTFGGAGNVTVSNVISGVGNLIKDGTGTLTLANTNTYTGSTTINGGTLALGTNNALPSATAVTINNGTLDAATFTNTLGTLAISGLATIHLGTGSQLAFADSHLVDWSAGTLQITGRFVSGSSLRFGTSSSGLTATQLHKFVVPGYGVFALDANGYLIAQQAGTAVFFR